MRAWASNGSGECEVSTLGFVDEDIISLFLDEIGGSTPLDTSIEIPTLQPELQPNKKRRRRPKHELDSLRKAVQELEERLAFMRLLAAEREAEDKSAGWQEVALRQRRQAEFASQTNAQLRVMVEEHQQIASEIQMMVLQRLKRARVEVPVLAQTLRPAPPRARYDVCASPKLFEALTSDLDGVQGRLEAVFQTAEFDSSSGDGSMRSSSLLTDSESAFFEIRHMERFPFPTEMMHRAIGTGIAHNTSKCPYSSLKEIDEDTIQCAFSELLPSENIVMTSKMVVRRRLEGERVVIVWTGIAEIEGGMAVRVRQSGWAIAEPRKVANLTRSTKHSSMVVRNVVRITPELPSAATTEDKRVQAGSMADLVLDAYRWLVSLIIESNENAMMREIQGKH